MAQEEMDYLVVSRLDYRKNGFIESTYNPVGSMIRIHDYKENPWWNDYGYDKEVFENLLGPDFGKKDFYYESKAWGFILETLENKIREVLKTMKKVPQVYIENPTEYLKNYKLENYVADFFIFNKETQKYENKAELDTIPNLDVCKKNKYLISNDGVFLRKYIWKENSLKLIETIKQTELETGNHKFHCE